MMDQSLQSLYLTQQKKQEDLRQKIRMAKQKKQLDEQLQRRRRIPSDALAMQIQDKNAQDNRKIEEKRKREQTISSPFIQVLNLKLSTLKLEFQQRNLTNPQILTHIGAFGNYGHSFVWHSQIEIKYFNIKDLNDFRIKQGQMNFKWKQLIKVYFNDDTRCCNCYICGPHYFAYKHPFLFVFLTFITGGINLVCHLICECFSKIQTQKSLQKSNLFRIKCIYEEHMNNINKNI